MLGVQARWVALALVPILAGATWAHWGNGWMFGYENGGWEYPAYLTLLAVAQAMLGDGAWALVPSRAVPGVGYGRAIARGRRDEPRRPRAHPHLAPKRAGRAPGGTAILTLVSHHLCPYVQRAAIALAEKGVPFERRWVDLSDKPAWFTALLPLGKVPLLVVRLDPEGPPATIFESAAVLTGNSVSDGPTPKDRPKPRHNAALPPGGLAVVVLLSAATLTVMSSATIAPSSMPRAGILMRVHPGVPVRLRRSGNYTLTLRRRLNNLRNIHS